jgi:hypothetical protein
LNMSSRILDSTRGMIGLVPTLASVRDRRDGRGRNSNRKRDKASPHILVELSSDPADTVHPLLEPEMIEPSLRTVEQALDEVPRKAKQTHRNDPWKVKKILLSGLTADRI